MPSIAVSVLCRLRGGASRGGDDGFDICRAAGASPYDQRGTCNTQPTYAGEDVPRFACVCFACLYRDVVRASVIAHRANMQYVTYFCTLRIYYFDFRLQAADKNDVKAGEQVTLSQDVTAVRVISGWDGHVDIDAGIIL